MGNTLEEEKLDSLMEKMGHDLRQNLLVKSNFEKRISHKSPEDFLRPFTI